MKEIVLYQTVDGKIFADKNEAALHERTMIVLPEEVKEPPHKSGIYRWTCKPEGKFYTGKAIDLNVRFWSFIDSMCGGARYSGKRIQEAIKKYPSLSSWEYSVLKYVDDKEELNESEIEKIREIPEDKSLNIQNIKENDKISQKFSKYSSEFMLTKSEYEIVTSKNRWLGKKYGFRFNINWSLMNLALNKHEISLDTVRYIPLEIGNALQLSITNSTCYKQVSDIGDRLHGFYAKVMNNGILSSFGPYSNIEDCKKKYLEEKIKIIKQVLPKYKDMIEKDVFKILDNLTVEDAEKLIFLK